MTLTTEDLLDLAPSVGQRSSTVRFDILDQWHNVIGELHPDSDNPAVVNNNINRTIKRDLTGVILNASQAGSINPFSERIRPVWVLENHEEFPLGVFILVDLDRSRFEWGLTEQIAGVDQTFVLDQPIERTVSLSKDGSVRDLIIEQFALANIPEYDIDITITTKAGAAVAWPAGTSRLAVINDLAALASAYSAFFDNSGVGHVAKIPDYLTVNPTLIYEFGGRILHATSVETNSALDAPNRYIVIDNANPDFAVTGFFDIPDMDEASFVNRGFYISTVITEQGLVDSAAATARAQSAYTAAQSGTSWVQFSSPPDPRHDTFDAVRYLGLNYREQGWSLPLREGSEMTHDLRRIWDGQLPTPTIPADELPPDPLIGYSDIYTDIYS